MSLFGKNEPVVLKEGSSAKEQLEALESLRGTLPAHVEKRLEADIRAVRAGMAGENAVMYELRNSHTDMFVLQDLFLEHDGLTAQIDFLVLTKQRNFVIECKNLYGNIAVNARGDFVRTFDGGGREGIYSPITQNRRHLELIRAMKRSDRGLVSNLMLDGEFDDRYRGLIVLANPKTVLDDRFAPEEVRRAIIRVDQLVATISAVNAQKGPGREKKAASAVRANAEWFLSQCKASGGADFAAKYREMVPNAGANPQNVARDGAPVAGAATTLVTSQPVGAISPGGAVLCPICGAPMVLRTAVRGAHAGERFYGCSNYPMCRGIVGIDATSTIR